MASFTVYFLGITFALYILFNLNRFTQRIRRMRHLLPGPVGLPIFGYLPFLDSKAPYKTLQRLSYKYGKMYSLRLGNVDCVVLCDAALVRDFLKREEFTTRAPLYLTHGIMGGFGLICAEGSLWRDQRRHTIEWLKSLGMAKSSLNDMRYNLEQRMLKGINDCVLRLKTEMRKDKILDPLPALQHTLGNIVNDLVFGKTYEVDDPTWKYLQTIQREGIKMIGISGMVNFLPWLRFLPKNRRNIKYLLEGKQNTHYVYEYIVEDRDCLLKQTKGANKSCVLDYFLEEKQKLLSSTEEKDKKLAEEHFSEKQLYHLLADLFGAGLDTTLATLRWFLLYMAKNEDMQQRLRRTLLTIPREKMNVESLEKIAFLRACISETQRLRSVVPMGIPHGTLKDTEINGYRIKKGTMILPLQWAIHMNTREFEHANRFVPYRFMDAEGNYKAHKQFMPFQAGKRMCMGEELARMMLLLYAGMLLRTFEFSVSELERIDLDGECGITLNPFPYKLHFKKLY